MIIIVICQYLNHTECLTGVVLRKNAKKLGSSFCSPWEGHLNFPADSEGSYFTYLEDYYLIENYIFPFAKGIIEKKITVLNFLIYLNASSLEFLKTLQILKEN